MNERFLIAAARLALRGHGRVEPNPLVGCVIVDEKNTIVGWGYHPFFGGPHAEIEALRRAGTQAKNATMYVTLEPCAHTGKTPPCAEAVMSAGIKKVVIGRRDTTTHAAGGAKMLEQAGIEVVFCEHIPCVTRLTDSFFHRVETNRPWVIAKWAQTIDGKIATRTGDSKWISGARSRRMVHRQRGRVDAILTGIGTVLHDDPLLTARHGKPRRTARRVVIDSNLEIPLDSKLVRTANEFPLTIFCNETVLTTCASQIQQLHEKNVDVIACSIENEIQLEQALRILVERYNIATVLVEAGAGLLGRLFAQSLVNEAWVFIAPLILGDEQGIPIARGRNITQLTDALPLKLVDQRQRGEDVMLRYET